MSNTRKTSRKLPNMWWERQYKRPPRPPKDCKWSVSVIIEVPAAEFGFGFLLLQYTHWPKTAPYRGVCSQTVAPYPTKLARKAWERYGCLAEAIWHGKLPMPKETRVFWGNTEMHKGRLSYGAWMKLAFGIEPEDLQRKHKLLVD